MSDSSSDGRSRGTLDMALLDAKAEVAVLAAAGGGIPDERAEGALRANDLVLTRVAIRLSSTDPRPVLEARYELTHGRTGEGRIVEVYVPAPSREPTADELDAAGVQARHQILQQLVGPSTEEGLRSNKPTIELPEIND